MKTKLVFIPVVYLGSCKGEAKGGGKLSHPLVYHATMWWRNSERQLVDSTPLPSVERLMLFHCATEL